MYGSSVRDTVIGDTHGLLATPELFSEVLTTVGREWPIATAQNLSDVYRNHQPWCGRAASCYEFGATISEVNEAWKQLTAGEQVRANRIADEFTFSWRSINMLGQMRWPV